MAKGISKTEAARRQEMVRARWRRNKRDERARKKPPEPPPPSEEFVAKVFAERDRRRQEYPWWLDWDTKWEGGCGSYELITDVWAARMILEKQFGVGRVSAGRVAKWMQARGKRYGYKDNSLRTIVYRAFGAIEILETFTGARRNPNKGATPWLPFDPDD